MHDAVYNENQLMPTKKKSFKTVLIASVQQYVTLQ